MSSLPRQKIEVGTRVKVIQHVATPSQLNKIGEVRFIGTIAEIVIVAMDGQKDRFDPKKPKCMLFNLEDVKTL